MLRSLNRHVLAENSFESPLVGTMASHGRLKAGKGDGLSPGASVQSETAQRDPDGFYFVRLWDRLLTLSTADYWQSGLT
jgi:hypothetical protein